MVDFEKGLEQENISQLAETDDPRVGPVVDNVSDEFDGTEENKTENLRENKPKKNYLKILVLFFGVILIILIIAILAFHFEIFGSNRISERQLIVGASLSFEENKSMKVKFDEEDHEIRVEKVGEDWAEIVIRSEPLRIILKVNEVIEVDLNNDDISDLRVKLFKVENGKAVIAVKRIDKEVCVESWVCGEWSICIADKRERVCTDRNDCGSEFFMPVLEQRCVGDSPVVSEGENLTENDSDLNDLTNQNQNQNQSQENLQNQTQIIVNNTTNNLDNTSVSSDSVCGSQYPCYESKGYFCPKNYDANSYSPYCCLTQCVFFESEEQFCDVRGHFYFEENETHMCKSGVLSPFNGSLIRCCSEIKRKTDLQTHMDYLETVDCSNTDSFECGTVNLNSLPLFEYDETTSFGVAINTIPSYDENCPSVCFGNAFLNGCSPAKINVINGEGDSYVLSIQGPDNSGGCSVKYILKESSKDDEVIYKDKFMICSVSISDIGLTENPIGCFPGDGEEPCLEVLPGAVFGDVFFLLHVSSYLDEESDFNCQGDLVDLTVEDNPHYAF